MSRHQILSSTKSIVSTITRLRRGHFWPAALLLVLGLAVIFGSEPRVAGLGASSIFGYATRAQDGRQDPPPASNPATIPSETQQACGLDCNATVPATGSVGAGVNFQGSATATNCSTSPSYSWTFGDGGTSTQQNPSHTYNGTGTFSWSMTVTASGGGGGSSVISTIAGGEGEGLPAPQVSFNRLNAIARDPQGRGIYLAANNLSSQEDGEYIYFVNTSNATVTIAGKTFAPGIARIVAGGGQFTDDNIAAFNTNIGSITGLGVRPDGNTVYFIDSTLSRVRALNVGTTTTTVGGGTLNPGNIRTLSGSGFGSSPALYGLAVNPLDSSVYVANISVNSPGNDTGGSRVYQIVASTGNTSIAVGSGAIPVSEGDGFEGNGTAAGSIRLFQPKALDFDTNGNLIVADSNHFRILRISAPATSGSSTTLLAQLPNNGGKQYPNGVGTVGTNVYVTNGDGQTIRLANGGSGQLVSGQDTTSCNYSSSPNSCGDGGPIIGAGYSFNTDTSSVKVVGMEGDASGIYVVDQSPNGRARVRYLNFSGSPVTLAGVTIAAGTIQTIAGTGLVSEPTSGNSGPRHFDGGAATGAFIDLPVGVGVTSTGNLWLTDSSTSSRLRFVNREASPVTLFAGTAAQQVVAPGTIVTANYGEPDAGDVVSAQQAQLNEPQGIFVNSQGVFVADTVGGPTVPSFGQRTSQLKFFNTSASNVVFYPSSASPITVPPGFMARIAGCSAVSCPDNGQARTTKFIGMTDVAVASNGDIYVTDVGQNAVRKISASTGAVSSVTTPFSRITGLGFGPDGRLYLTDTQAGNLLRATDASNTSFTTLATGLGSPRDVAVASDGSAYVTSGFNSRVFLVTAAGAVSTFAGTTAGFSGDGGPPASAQVNFNVPTFNVASLPPPIALPRTINIVTSASGEVIFADPENGRIRRVGGGAGGASCVRSGTIQINSTNNPVPTTTSLSPTQTSVGGGGFVLTVNGTNFIPTSTVRWNANNRTTTFINANQLQAQIPASDIASAGVASVTVFNAAPGGGTSNAQTFTVTNPVPTTTSLSPGSAVAGGPGFTLTVFGTSFVSTSTVNWNGSPRTTTFINAGQLTAAIPASDITNVGTASVTVVNPTPGGGTSTPALTFNITSVAQGLEGDVAPRPGGNGAVSLADWVQIGRFAAGLDTVNVGTEFQRADTAPLATLGNGAVSLADWVQAGRFAAALDPVPAAGGPTGPPVFAPEIAARALASIANVPDQTRPVRVIPTSITRGQNGTITIELTTTSGENAISFTVNFDTAQLTYVPPAGGNNNLLIGPGMPASSAIVVNDLQLAAGRLGILLSAPFGTAIPAGVRQILNLTFMATTSGSGSSTQVGFGTTPVAQELTDANGNILPVSFTAGTITLVSPNNPVPTISSINPPSITAGSANFTLTVTGTNYVNGSIVRFNGTDRVTSFVSPTQLTATITAADVQNAGTPTITVFNPAPGGGTSNGTTLTVNAAQNPVPTVTSINPTSANAGSAAFSLTVNGTGFVGNSVVNWNGSARPTTFNSATQLTAAIPATDVQNAGASTITVFSPGPGGGLSPNGQTFTINAAQNPVPTITSLSPNPVTAGGAGFNLIVTGTNFIATSSVRVNGNARTTVFNSPTQLTASVTAADIASAGTANITVFNPEPGGGTSNTVGLTVNTAGTSTVRVVGATIQRGAAGTVAVELVSTGLENAVGFTLTFNQTELGFVSGAPGSGATGAQVNINSANAASGILVVNIAQSPGVAFQAGTRQLVTLNFTALAGGSAATTPIAFSNTPIAMEVISVGAQTLPSLFQAGTVTITQGQSPVPTITNITPTTANLNSAAFTLTVNGTNFVSGSVVSFNGSPRTTTFVNGTQLTAAIAEADLQSAGAKNITVTNPAPGGGASNVVVFTVIDPSNPLPSITNVNPSSVTAGSGAVTLTITGTNFVNGSNVQFNGIPQTTTFNSTTQLSVQIPASSLTTAGTANIVVINPPPGGGNSNAFLFTINNPAPTVMTLAPASISVGSAAFTLTVNGTNFTQNSVILFNGSVRTTSFVSPTQVTALISENDLAAAGTATVTVQNPAPGGGTSNVVNFVISAGGNLPVITSLDPNTALAGGPAFQLRVFGSNFTLTSRARWNGVDRNTTFDNAGQLTVTIPASDIAQGGTATVTVFIAGINGGSSNPATFTIQGPAPAPTLTSLNPSSIAAGSGAFTLTVNGTNFVNGASVQINGSPRTTTFVSATQLQVQVLASDIAAQGAATVRVFNPAPDGGSSNELILTITAANPAPTLTSLSPSTVLAGSGAFTLQVNGAGFVNGSVIRVNGADRATSFISATQLQAQISAAEIANAGSLSITVVTPGPGGGTSNALALTIQGPNAVPTITGLTPGAAVIGGAAFTLTVTGTNFVNGSVVRWNGQDRATTFGGPGQLQAQIPASDLTQAGTNVVTVFTPAPGGGVSNGFNFVVGDPNQIPTLTSISPNTLPALSGAFELTVNGANFVNGAVVEWNGAARPTIFVSASVLRATIPASDLQFPGTASITVSNPPPGGGRSTAFSFAITNPIPVINALNPSVALVGSQTFTLLVTGTNFIEGSVVRWNGSNRPTTFINSTQLTAQIPASDLTAVGTAAVTVFTPAPGGGISNTLNFSVVTPNPGPTLTSISPSFATVGGNEFTLTANGANFVNGAIVQWNGQARPTTFVSSTQLRAQIPRSDIAFEGTASVTVLNPAPGGGTSIALKFTIGRSLALVNAASFVSGGAIGQDSIVAAFGTSLATGIASAAQVPLPTSLLGTSITVRDANGTERTAGLFAVAPGQVNFLLPAGTSLGTAVVTVSSPGGSVSVGQIQVNRVGPGIFAANSNGQGVASARLFRRKANGQITDEPIAQLSEGGQFIPIPIDLGPETDEVFLVFFGTGIRGRLNLADVMMSIGGVNIPVIFGAAQGGFAGLDQINTARLPRSLIGRGLVNVVITVEGQQANTVQVNFK